MEILIIGLILVALMVYASTRIKRTAAAAFERETIETDTYVIQKPEGYLHKLNGDPQFLFEAYSREFSKSDPKLRLGTAKIDVISGPIEAASAELEGSGTVTDELNETIGEYR